MSAPTTESDDINRCGTLHALTVELPSALASRIDLIELAGDSGLLFVHEHGGFAALGVALRIALPRGTNDVSAVSETLDAIMWARADGTAGEPGDGPLAVGALPFVPGEAGSLIVPRLTVVCHESSSVTATLVAADGTMSPDTVINEVQALVDRHRPPRWSPHDFELRSCTPHQDWCDGVARAVARLRAKELDKVVLARAVDVVANGPLVIETILQRLHALYPSCAVFSIEGFIGASPELLLSRTGDRIESYPLAGTVARSGDPDHDAVLAAGLLASKKDRWEHSLVIDELRDRLAVLCDDLDVPDAPSIVPLRNVSHLGTRITARLAASSLHLSALELAARIHPTAAVGGRPLDTALSIIAETEALPRGRYAGPVGWVDQAGNGRWMVGIRSAQIEGNTARLIVGNGIVDDSDPLAELAETQLKLQALLSAVVRP